MSTARQQLRWGLAESTARADLEELEEWLAEEQEPQQ
jgi:hypothetical protein